MRTMMILLLCAAPVHAGWRADCRHAVRDFQRSCRVTKGIVLVTTTTSTTTSTIDPVQPADYNSENCYLPGIRYRGVDWYHVTPYRDVRQCSPQPCDCSPDDSLCGAFVQP